MFGDSEVRLIRRGIKFSYSQGIWLDIFPLDDIPDDEKTFHDIYRKAMFYRRAKDILYSTLYDYTPARKKWKRPFKAALHALLKHTNIGGQYVKYFEKYIGAIAEFDYPDSKRVANLDVVGMPNFLKDFLLQRSYFDETVYLNFEMLTLPTSSCYEKILTHYYGDWHQYKIQCPHSMFYDTEKSYKYYVEHGLPESVKI